MKTLKYVLTITCLLLFSAGVILAAGDEFTVIATKGEATFQKNGKGNWEKLKTGLKLSSSDKVKVSGGAYLGMLYSKGGTVELKEAGQFSMSDLSKSLASKKSSVSQKISGYIAESISTDNDKSKDKYRKNMAITGAVERSVAPDVTILLTSPKRTSVLLDKVSFSWIGKPGTSYKIVVTDRFDKPVITKISAGNTVTIESKELGENAPKDAFYLWSVCEEKNPEQKSDTGVITFLSEQKASQVKESLKSLQNESALDKIVLASFYEQNNLMVDALNSYKEAVALSPDVPDYKDMFDRFCDRNSIKH